MKHDAAEEARKQAFFDRTEQDIKALEAKMKELRDSLCQMQNRLALIKANRDYVAGRISYEQLETAIKNLYT